MKEINETRDKISKEILETSHSKMETFDDIARGGEKEGIQTFDDIARQKEMTIINTFDDIANPNKHQNFEIQENQRINELANKLKQENWLKPEVWSGLDETEKRVALERAGAQLSDVYHHPAPPIFAVEEEKTRLGSYGDGYSSDNKSGNIVGNDYRIELNKEGQTKNGGKLFGDDPKEALHTYLHEFRHSYQHEQAHASDKHFFVENPNQAKEWSENLKPGNYKNPPFPELVNVNREQYEKLFSEYENQPIEKDANRFADEIVQRVYSK